MLWQQTKFMQSLYVVRGWWLVLILQVAVSLHVEAWTIFVPFITCVGRILPFECAENWLPMSVISLAAAFLMIDKLLQALVIWLAFCGILKLERKSEIFVITLEMWWGSFSKSITQFIFFIVIILNFFPLSSAFQFLRTRNASSRVLVMRPLNCGIFAREKLCRLLLAMRVILTLFGMECFKLPQIFFFEICLLLSVFVSVWNSFCLFVCFLLNKFITFFVCDCV